jgi:hypothetical protein
MNQAARTPLIPEAERGIAEARLAAFDRDGLGHTPDVLRQWSAARAGDPAAPCPPPFTLALTPVALADLDCFDNFLRGNPSWSLLFCGDLSAHAADEARDVLLSVSPQGQPRRPVPRDRRDRPDEIPRCAPGLSGVHAGLAVLVAGDMVAERGVSREVCANEL